MINVAYIGAFFALAIGATAVYLLLHGNGWNFEVSTGGAIAVYAVGTLIISIVKGANSQ